MKKQILPVMLLLTLSVAPVKGNANDDAFFNAPVVAEAVVKATTEAVVKATTEVSETATTEVSETATTEALETVQTVGSGFFSSLWSSVTTQATDLSASITSKGLVETAKENPKVAAAVAVTAVAATYGTYRLGRWAFGFGSAKGGVFSTATSEEAKKEAARLAEEKRKADKLARAKRKNPELYA